MYSIICTPHCHALTPTIHRSPPPSPRIYTHGHTLSPWLLDHSLGSEDFAACQDVEKVTDLTGTGLPKPTHPALEQSPLHAVLPKGSPRVPLLLSPSLSPPKKPTGTHTDFYPIPAPNIISSPQQTHLLLAPTPRRAASLLPYHRGCSLLWVKGTGRMSWLRLQSPGPGLHMLPRFPAAQALLWHSSPSLSSWLC